MGHLNHSEHDITLTLGMRLGVPMSEKGIQRNVTIARALSDGPVPTRGARVRQGKLPLFNWGWGTSLESTLRRNDYSLLGVILGRT